MESRSILLVYGTSYGHTQKIIERMAAVIRDHGGRATVVPGELVPNDFVTSSYDGVIVGASVIGGRHQRCVQRFIERERAMLNAMPSAFFSVSGSAGSTLEESRQTAFRVARDFVESLGWRPAVLETIAGEIAYRRYWFGLRFVMRMIARKQGGPTDTSRDIDLTDWVQVDRLALQFMDRVESVRPSTAPSGV